jgi:ParB-like chromosome segregation protein Spo0J
MAVDKKWPAHKAEVRKVSELHAYENNPRVHTDAQIDLICNSMKQFGWTMPILVNEQNVVLAGHARLMAGTKLGYIDVPVIVARGWSPEQQRAYVIADNHLTDISDWDRDILRLEIESLGDFDLTSIGLDEQALDKLLGSAKGAPGEFAEFDENIATEHTCPKCGYSFSGGKGLKASDDAE